MPSSQISLPFRENPTAESSRAASKKASKNPPLKKPAAKAKEPRAPVVAFDELSLRDFEAWLMNEKGRLALDPHRRAHLRTILQPDFQPSRQDILGVDKTSKQIKRENTEKWKARKAFDLDDKNQIIRNPEGNFGPRAVACIWDAANYIIDRH